MEKYEFKQKWNEVKKYMHEKWNWMTESDINQIHGEYDRWLHMMEKKGYSKTEAEWEFKNWNWQAKSWDKSSEKGWNKEQDWHQQGEKKSEGAWGREVKQDPWSKQGQKNQKPKKKGDQGGWGEGKKRKAG